MRGRRFNRCFTGIGVSIMALMIAACAETSIGSLPSPSADAPAKSGPENSASAASLMRLAEASRAAGDRVTAINLYHRAALAAAPEDAALQIRAGFILHELGAFAEADGAFRRALVVAPGNAEALRGLGITLVARDMPHHAIEKFVAAIAAGGDPRAYNALGVAHDMNGDRGAAQQAYADGLERDPENLTLLNNLGLSLALSGQHAEAISVLGRVTASPNATPRHRQNLALAYGLAGRADLAADVSNNDLAMRDVQNNLGYYAWLRDQPGNQNDLSATLGTPGADLSTGTMVANDAAPMPLSATPTVAAEESAAGAPPLRISPLITPDTGAQSADMTHAGANSSTKSGEDDTVWQLIDTVDETPAKDAPKAAADAKPVKVPAENEGANAAIEAANADTANTAEQTQTTAAEPVTTEAAATEADAPSYRVPDEIAHAIIMAPVSELAENTDAAFDGSAYSRHFEGAPEFVIQDTPESDTTLAAEIDGAAAADNGTTATDMTAEDWAVANRSEAESVAAPSAQFAMLPEDSATDMATDMGTDMNRDDMAPGATAAAAADSDTEFTAPHAEIAPTQNAPDQIGNQTAQAPHGHAASEALAAADASAATSGETAGHTATASMPEPESKPMDTPTEMARSKPEPMATADSAGSGPASQSTDNGQIGDNGQINDVAADPMAERDGSVASAYPYTELPREQLAQYPPADSVSNDESGSRSRPAMAANGGMSLGAGASGLQDSGPNVVMLAALGAAMFLIVALLALGRMRQRTGVPEPE